MCSPSRFGVVFPVSRPKIVKISEENIDQAKIDRLGQLLFKFDVSFGGKIDESFAFVFCKFNFVIVHI